MTDTDDSSFEEEPMCGISGCFNTAETGCDICDDNRICGECYTRCINCGEKICIVCRHNGVIDDDCLSGNHGVF